MGLREKFGRINDRIKRIEKRIDTIEEDSSDLDKMRNVLGIFLDWTEENLTEEQKQDLGNKLVTYFEATEE